MYTWGYIVDLTLAKLDLTQEEALNMQILEKLYMYANEAMTQICSTVKPCRDFYVVNIYKNVKVVDNGLIIDDVKYEDLVLKDNGDIVNSNTNKIDLTEDGVDITADSGARVNGNAIETQNNKVTSISNSSTDTQYPSAKCVYDTILNEKGIINLTGTQENPINMATDMEVGKLYSCSGYVRMDTSNVYTLETDNKIMAFKPSATKVNWINAVIIGTGIPSITSGIGGNATLTINSSTGSVISTSPTKSIASLNGVLGQTNYASFYAPTSAGTSGYLLQSNGTGNAPTFAIEKSTSISNASTDSQVPTAKAVYDYIDGLNATEVSY